MATKSTKLDLCHVEHSRKRCRMCVATQKRRVFVHSAPFPGRARANREWRGTEGDQLLAVISVQIRESPESRAAPRLSYSQKTGRSEYYRKRHTKQKTRHCARKSLMANRLQLRGSNSF